MPELLRMPEVAANTTSAILAAWPIEANVEYRTKDAIVTVETDKAVVDVEADSDGVILKMLVDAGANVEVGAPIALVGKPGETVDDLNAVLAELGVTDAASTAATEPDTTEGRVEPGAPSRIATAPSTPVNGVRAGAMPARLFASPLARRLARDHGLTLDDLTGTGPNGRIVRKDVELAVAEQTSLRPGPGTNVTTEAAAGPAQAARSSESDYDDTPNTRLRTAIATRLSESKQTVPHFYLRGTANVDALLALRSQLNAAAPIKISVNDLIVKAVARAHSALADVNAIWVGHAIRRFHNVDVAVAVATPNGLVTPVVRNADQLAVTAVAQTTRDFAERAREGQLRQNELEGGSTTVSNLGMYGTEEFAAIINPPQSTILAVGAARPEPVVRDGNVVVASVLHMTLSVDHRVIDGALAAQWMRTLVETLENPLAIII